MASNRIKYAYINYDEIADRIESGKIDQYDVIFTRDTHEQYFVKEDLSLLRIMSKVYCFDSVQNAVKSLNESSDTYAGQIVAISDNDLNVYHGYIVNKVDREYTVTSLADSGTQIDYDALAHRPIINMAGELANPVIIGSLENGLYSISGVYKIFQEHETIFSTSTKHLFLVDRSETNVYVKDISAKEMTTYTLSDGEVIKSEIITTGYLEDNHYISENDLDAKIEALDLVTKAEASEYVKQITTEYLNENLGNTIDEKIDERIASIVADDSDINNLFNN